MIKFLPYQEKWIKDTSRIKLMEKSRQIGMSWTAAFSLVKRHNSNRTNKLDSWVSSRDITQAKLFLEDCKQFAQNSNSMNLQDDSSLPIKKSKVQQSSNLMLYFPNKTRIHSLSSNPNAQAGKRGTRVLDEFALHPDPQKLYTIAYPGITWGGQLEIISTHRGSNNFFNHLIQEIKFNDNPKKISHYRVTLEDALNAGFLNALKEKLPPDDPYQTMDEAAYFDQVRNSCADRESFFQEYMCQPCDENTFFLHPSLIESCEIPSDTPWEYSFPEAIRSPHDFFLGIDIGRDHDLTVFCLLEKMDNVLNMRKLVALQNIPFSIQEEFLHNFLLIPTLRRTCIDQTGLGRQFTERASHFSGYGVIQGISFTNLIKESLAFNLRSTLENRAILIPPDKELRADLRSIKRQSTSSGNIRFNADSAKTGHADRFWAMALAVHAAKSCNPNSIYVSIPKESNSLYSSRMTCN